MRPCLEAPEAAGLLDLAEDRLDHRLATGVDRASGLTVEITRSGANASTASRSLTP
jgi:hypothetical protein